MYNKFYIAMATLILLGYAACEGKGMVLGGKDPQFIPADARQAAGGYRSFHFWHSGYQGGK